MNVEKVRQDFDSHVLPASFSAKGPGPRSDGPRVLVYRYKSGLGFLWAYMEGSIIDEGSNVIKDGGKTRSYRDAVDNAVDRLMVRVDR